MQSLLQRIGYWLSCWLSCPRPQHLALPNYQPRSLLKCLRPGDVLLVEGTSRVSTAIKYLTQSSWSHAALYVGEATEEHGAGYKAVRFVEADLTEGVRVVGFEEYRGLNLRICRPVGLSNKDIDALVRFACQRVGYQYDLRNIIDLARYLLPLPPVPPHWRRGMLGLGSGDPTRAICSTLIAQAFQSVRYPILPDWEWTEDELRCHGCKKQVLKKRHYTLFTPRDFDFSPYFLIVKPVLDSGFDPHILEWNERIESA
ncbi:YiiX/YebB-like N1pC/P60 family cysteine hydrolase [Halomonas sp. M20]|uniref:YiiX/YebB-like N1pC/P60 family cysteine hydrolase n=1 Tax=Halomonas sp. M20 TaxID=2763264 RepID=UPI001D0A0147|nr:YiiX/YebB-like N1pC/P60 family cysteine hydrolase [Halomonas sp. M20]